MSSQSVARVFVLVADLAGVAALILLRPPPLVSLVVLAATWCAFRWAWPRKPRVAAAVLANNLLRIAALLAERSSRGRKAA